MASTVSDRTSLKRVNERQVLWNFALQKNKDTSCCEALEQRRIELFGCLSWGFTAVQIFPDRYKGMDVMHWIHQVFWNLLVDWLYVMISIDLLPSGFSYA